MSSLYLNLTILKFFSNLDDSMTLRCRENNRSHKLFMCSDEGSKAFVDMSFRNRCVQKRMHDLKQLCM